MPTPIYLRKAGEEDVRLHTLVEMTKETGSRLEFQSKTYVSVDSQSHYYITRRSPNGSMELWLVELHCEGAMEEPYTYTAVVRHKYRDLPEGWLQDE